MEHAYIALGSNLGDRQANLRWGIDRLAGAGVLPQALSSVWETEPVDSLEPLWFLNMVGRFATERPPLDLLELLLEVERDTGRVRRVRNEPRLLDLDLLLYGDARIRDARLEVPHPRMWLRRFVLAPLAEIAPRVVNPATGRTALEELHALDDAAVARPLGVLARAEADPL